MAASKTNRTGRDIKSYKHYVTGTSNEVHRVKLYTVKGAYRFVWMDSNGKVHENIEVR